MKKLLIVGYGDIAKRVDARLPAPVEQRRLSRTFGLDLDRPETLSSISGWPDAILHCAPPPGDGDGDVRTSNLLAALGEGRILPTRLVYLSTSGVYGDCGGALVDETRPRRPRSARGRRRADAERQLETWCALRGVALVVLRVPGIYAADRLPLERLHAGTPALRPEDDVYTNHIHADDLASIAIAALRDDAPPGVYNASDDTQMKMGDWFDLVADRHGLPRPPRISRGEAATRMPPALLEFMSESRRLDNRRLKTRLGVRLAYPTVEQGVPRARNAA